MKICMVTHDYPPRLGGIATHVFQLSKQLVALGNEVVIIAPKPTGVDSAITQEDGIELLYVRNNIDYSCKSKVEYWRQLLSYALKAKALLKKLVESKSCDLVHYHNCVAESLVTKGIRGLPIVFTAHESHLLKLAEQRKKRLYYYLSHPHYLIAPSRELLDTAIRYGSFPMGSSYIPNGVDPVMFAPAPKNGIIEEAGINRDSLVILSARRLEEKNGVQYLVKALPIIIEHITKAKLVVVGSGSQLYNLKDLSHRLGVARSVLWLGAKDNAEMPKYYNLANVVVLPSLKEATSIAGLEAMSCGRPLVGTTVGGIPDLIDDEVTGYLTAPKNPKLLAEKVVRLLSRPKEAENFGTQARKKILENYTWEKIARRTVDVYQSVIHQN